MHSNKLKIDIFKRILFSIFLVFSLASCSQSTNNSIEASDDFLNSISKMVDDSYAKINVHLSKDDVILVSDFVNIDKLKNHSKLGFLLSEKLKNELSLKNIIVKEVELSKNFVIGERGFNLLSRKSKDINAIIDEERFAMVGTYSITNKRLILFIKLIDIRTGHILSSSYQSMEMNSEIYKLEFVEKPKERRIFQPMTL